MVVHQIIGLEFNDMSGNHCLSGNCRRITAGKALSWFMFIGLLFIGTKGKLYALDMNFLGNTFEYSPPNCMSLINSGENSSASVFQPARTSPASPDHVVCDFVQVGEPSSRRFSLIVLLFPAIVLLAVGFYFLYSAIQFQRWVIKQEENAPDPLSGLQFSTYMAIVIFILSIGCWGLTNPEIVSYINACRSQQEITRGLLMLLSNLLASPEYLIAGMISAGLIPGSIAVLKFFMIAQLNKHSMEGTIMANSVPAARIGGIISLLHICASVATLIGFFHTMK
jgi:hypothetical protein